MILFPFLKMNLQEMKTLLELVSQPFLSVGILVSLTSGSGFCRQVDTPSSTVTVLG